MSWKISDSFLVFKIRIIVKNNRVNYTWKYTSNVKNIKKFGLVKIKMMAQNERLDKKIGSDFVKSIYNFRFAHLWTKITEIRVKNTLKIIKDDIN